MNSDDKVISVLLVCVCVAAIFFSWSVDYFEAEREANKQAHEQQLIQFKLEQDKLDIRKQELRIRELELLSAFVTEEGDTYIRNQQ